MARLTAAEPMTPAQSITAPLLSAEQAAEQGRQWAELRTSGNRLFWLEFDPTKGTNRVLCQSGQGESRALTPDGYSVRSRVHEYGGGSFCIADDQLVFVNDNDQGLYRQSIDNPEQLTPIYINPEQRFGDLLFDSHRRRIIAVEELHRDGRVFNRLVSIGLGNSVTGREPGSRTVLVQGDDFYASPRLSDCGSQLAWISWNHPHQPWTSSCLWLGRLDSQGVPQGQQKISSGHYWGHDESVVQPEFGPDGSLYFLSDRSGWWNLYRYFATREGYTEALLPSAAEFSRAPWQLGQRSYVILDQHRIGCSWWNQGRAGIGELYLPTRQLRELGEWPAIHSLAQQDGDLLAITEPATQPGQIWRWPLASQPEGHAGYPVQQIEPTLCSSASSGFSPSRHIEIPSSSGETLYGLLYQPLRSQVVEPGGKLPLIIQLHGGPTAQADGRFDPLKQFWLQRGYAMLDLNYRGSSGYGRRYRHSLKGQWGISDVEDVNDAAQYCIDQGWADSERILVRGGSAGGYTALQVLCQPGSRSLVTAGASLYGISDLERLNRETHKFESHYLSWLIGDPAEQQLSYRLRSPIHKLDDFKRPLIFFQGGLDRVVPATQTYRLFNQLNARGVEVEYHAFANERHGFRHAANRAKVLSREWAFYQQQLKLENVQQQHQELQPNVESDYVQRTG